jgi:beta-aspartyl-dipeptidase (metallo-type)
MLLSWYATLRRSFDSKRGIQLILLKNARPISTDEKFKGKCVDILIAGDCIAAMEEALDIGNLPVETIDLDGRKVSPGLIDGHVHFTGAAWDEGFSSKTPEIFLSEFIRGGITTAVGINAFGYGCESLEALSYKTQTLTAEGLSAYMYTGNFRCPQESITSGTPMDIVMMPHVIGAKVSMTDKFSSHPSMEELCRMASEVYVAGLQTGKAGVLHIHIAEFGDAFSIIERIREITGIPSEIFVPTHCNTDTTMLDSAAKYAARGGCVDISGILEAARGCVRSIKASRAIESMVDEGVASDRITLSSDGNVGLPYILEDGTRQGLYVERVSSIWDNTRDMIKDGLPPELAISFACKNPASRLKLHKKGWLDVGMDADILVFDDDWNIERVYMKGRAAMANGEPLMYSPFELDLPRSRKEKNKTGGAKK